MGTRKLPKGWEYQELGNLVEINYGTRIVKKNNIPGDYPVYGGGGISFSTQNFNRENKLKIGRFGLSKHNCVQFIEGKFFLNDSGLTLSIKNTDIIEKYLNFFLIGYKDKIYELSRGQGQRNLEISEFKKLKIGFPTSKEEQQKIVDYLDEKFKYIDEMEASRERYVEHLEKLEKAVLRDVFENIKGEEKKFKDIVNNHDGKREPLSQLVRADRKGKYDYYGASGIIDRIDDYIYDGEYLLISEDGANLTVRKYPIAFIAKGKFWVNNHAHVVSGKEGIITNNYLKLFFAYKDINEFITGVTQPKLSQTNLNKIKVPVPDIKTQKIIAYELDKKFELIRDSRERLKRQEENYKNLRKAFLNDVFGGFEE